MAPYRHVKEKGRGCAAGCVEGLWFASLKGQGKRFLGLTGHWPEGYGRLSAAGCVEGLYRKVRKMDGPYGPKGS